MTTILQAWSYLIGGLLLVVATVVLIVVSRTRKTEGDESFKFKWSHLLIWPLLDDVSKLQDGTRKHFFTKRETVGWAIVIAIIIVAMVLVPSHRG